MPNEIVSTVAFKDAVFIFCRNGQVYKMSYDYLSGIISFSLCAEMFR